MKYGSEKQISWAEDIKASLTFDNVKDHPVITKAKELIMANDDANWWINNRNRTGYDMIRAMLTGGLMISNRGNAKFAEIAHDGSSITITWTEIVSDDKGGHEEDRKEIIKI